MKWMSLLTLAVIGVSAIGCGNAHCDRDAAQGPHTLSQDAVRDVNRAVHEAEHATDNMVRAVNTTAVGAEAEVRQAIMQVDEGARTQARAARAVHEADQNRPADPAQLGREIKRDAVDAAGAAAERATEELFKIK
jgi:hypothetical protein